MVALSESRKLKVVGGNRNPDASSRGQTTTEYVLILALIVVPMAIALDDPQRKRGIRYAIRSAFERIVKQIAAPGL